MSQQNAPAVTGNTSTELKRELGLFSVVAIVAGSMIGSGIFVAPSYIAQMAQTPGIMLAVWIVAGMLTVMGASAYGKLVAKHPDSGGQYKFLLVAWGELPAFLYGWIFLTVVQAGFMAAVSIAFAKYTGVLLPWVDVHNTLASLGVFSLTSEHLVAIVVLLALTFLNTRGVRYGALVQNVFTSTKFLSLLGLIIVCAIGSSLLWGDVLMDWSLNWRSTANPLMHPTGIDFPTALAFASVGALFSSDAWNYATFVGGEVKDPTRNIPRGLVIGAVITVVLYVLANLAYLNVLPFEAIANAPNDRVASLALAHILGPLGAAVITIVILISTFGCVNGLLMAGARVFYAMAQDGLLFKAFGKVHPVTRTPNTALWFQFCWACVLVVSGSYQQLLDYEVFGAILFYMLTLLGLMKLGLKDPAGYQMTRWYNYLPPTLYIVGVGFVAFYLLISPQKQITSLSGVGLIAIGVPVFWLWKRIKRSAA